MMEFVKNVMQCFKSSSGHCKVNYFALSDIEWQEPKPWDNLKKTYHECFANDKVDLDSIMCFMQQFHDDENKCLLQEVPWLKGLVEDLQHRGIYEVVFNYLGLGYIDPNDCLDCGEVLEQAYQTVDIASLEAEFADSAFIMGCPDCPENYEPVCGTDGVTHSDDCHLDTINCWNPKLGSITKAYEGACQGKSIKHSAIVELPWTSNYCLSKVVIKQSATKCMIQSVGLMETLIPTNAC